MYIRRPLCLFGVLFAAVLTVVLYLSGERDALSGRQTVLDGKKLVFEGTVRGIEEKNNRLIVQIGSISVSDTDILFYSKDDPVLKDRLHIGTKVKAEGIFRLMDEADNKGQFDRRRYYALKGYGYEVRDGKILGISASYDVIRDRLKRIGDRTEDVYDRYLKDDESGVIKALVLADRDDLDEDLKEQYKDAGISHILALSGLHIVTLGCMLLAVLRKFGLPTAAAAVISLSIMMMYCIMTGMPVSAVRAMIMFAFLAVSLIAGRTYDLRTAAAFASVLMLITNPDRIYDPGFILSFSSVIGIGIIYPGLREIVLSIFGRKRMTDLHRSPRLIVRAGMGLLKTLLFSFALQITVMPFTMWFFYQLPVYGIPVNMLVVPFAGMLLFAGILTGILGNIALCFPGGSRFFDPVLAPPVYAVRIILKGYDIITGFACGMPGSVWITGRPKMWQMWVYYLILAVTVSGGYLLKAREHRCLRNRKKVIPDENRKETSRRLKMSCTALALLWMTGMGLLCLNTAPDIEISALDVGQGQCFVIHGRKVPSVVYDCGSTDENRVGRYRLVPFLKYSGIGKIDTFFVSHLDSDHVSGLLELLNEEDLRTDIGRIIISGSGEQEDSENYPKLMKAAVDRDIPVYTMSADDSIRWDDLSVTCISPKTGVSEKYDDINDGSLTLDIEYRKTGTGQAEKPLRMLFTGDISSRIEEELAEHIIENTGAGYDYLQVAHHGSRTAASKAFINRVSPTVAVISAGKDNMYGHPHKETLDILNECAGTHTYITGLDGETDCDLDDGSIRIFLFK